MYTGEGKGGPDPKEEAVVFQTTLPLLILYYLYPQFHHQGSNESLDILNIHIILTMTAPPQHKQRYYYIFWTIATLAVVCGQIYVASSYHSMSSALSKLLWSIA